MTTAKDWVETLRRQIQELPVEALTQDDHWLVVDVREPEEWTRGHLPGAHHLSRGFLELRIEQLCADRDQPIALYCRSGVRSLLAAEAVQRLGYREVASVAGGFLGWVDAGEPFVVLPSSPTPASPAVNQEGPSRGLLLAAPPALAAATAIRIGPDAGALTLVETSSRSADRGAIDPGLGLDAAWARRQALTARPEVSLAAAPAYLTAANADALIQSCDVVLVDRGSVALDALLDAAASRPRACVFLPSTDDRDLTIGLAMPGSACPRCVLAAMADRAEEESTRFAGTGEPTSGGLASGAPAPEGPASEGPASGAPGEALEVLADAAANVLRGAKEARTPSALFRPTDAGTLDPTAVIPSPNCGCA